ncbi:MAG: O-succinylhomoserine sulfhydrylase [Burkholderiaceae bacterium]
MTKPGTAAEPQHQWQPETLAIRTGLPRTQYQEHGEAIFATSSFVFDDAAQAAARFANEDPGFMYSRAGNPSVAMFQNRLAAMEGAQACLASASGMSAIMATFMGLCSAGDHIVAARELFGATVQLFGILKRFGIESTFVPLADNDAWAAAIQPNTRLLYLETPSNPLTQIGDIRALAELAHSRDAHLVVDNCFCSPAIQRPLSLGADLVIHSATKYLDGQGRIMGGAVAGSAELVTEKLVPFMRTSGAVMAPFNAWVALKGMETLSVRMRQHSANALEIAHWLQTVPTVSRVWYPGLVSHPQHQLASSQQVSGGAMLSFEVIGDSDEQLRANAWQVVNACKLLSITANLGDVKTTVTHPASTTHGRVDPEVRRAAGLSEGLIRIAVGLESPIDIKADLALGLEKLA